MSRTFGVCFVAAAVAFGVSVMAIDTERPTPEHQNLMRSNAALTSVSGIRAKIEAKDYDAIANDAVALQGNLAKVEAFWTPRKVADAIEFARSAIKAAGELEAAAKAKDDKRILRAQRTVTLVCNQCHQAHRLIVPLEGRFEIM